MQTSELDHLDTTPMDGEEHDLAPPITPEDAVDRLGIKISSLVLGAALSIAALWEISMMYFSGWDF